MQPTLSKSAGIFPDQMVQERCQVHRNGVKFKGERSLQTNGPDQGGWVRA